MTSMQDKILGILKEVTPEGLDFIQQGNWANTGHIYVQDGFDTQLDVAYQFNPTSCTIELSGFRVNGSKKYWTDCPPTYRHYAPATSAGRSKVSIAFHALDYTDGQRIKVLIKMYSDLLKGE